MRPDFVGERPVNRSFKYFGTQSLSAVNEQGRLLDTRIQHIGKVFAGQEIGWRCRPDLCTNLLSKECFQQDIEISKLPEVGKSSKKEESHLPSSLYGDSDTD
jgi:hypothetical protein